jgi:cytochrome c oxidase subunit II
MPMWTIRNGRQTNGTRPSGTPVQPGSHALTYSRRHFLFATLVLTAARGDAQRDTPSSMQRVSVTARRYSYEPSRIEVAQDDVVRIELHTADIVHSMRIDAYRISKRVGPDSPVTFEFRADKAGTFPFYCSLQIDEGCRRMRGELVVRARR